ncbi:MAG: hypothetical protein AAFQ15_10940 [Pseudomonadota bacterium]
MPLEIRTFGRLALKNDGKEVSLPASRKTRALLAFLICSAGAVSRQTLCELFWDAPDDPLASLRWSLSKLRGAVNTPEAERVNADRKVAWFLPIDARVDVRGLHDMTKAAICAEHEANEMWNATSGVWLEDCERLNQAAFAIWLESQRKEMNRSRSSLARRFARDPELDWQERDKWAERWLNLTPYSQDAAALLSKPSITRPANRQPLHWPIISSVLLKMRASSRPNLK